MKRIFKIVTFLLIMIVPFTASAADIKIEKEVTTYEGWSSQEGGEIIITISNITIDDDVDYEYQLWYGDQATEWHEITNISPEDDEVIIKLDKDEDDIVELLTISDIVYLNIKQVSGDVENVILSSYKVNVSMPLSRAFKVGHFTSGYHGIDPIYDVDKIYYQYKKVDNIELIKKYLDYLEGYDDSSNIYWGFYVDNLIDTLDIEDEMPETGWIELEGTKTTTQPTEEGLYYLWMMAPAANGNKELVGCVFSKRFSEIEILEEQLDDLIEKENVNKEQKSLINQYIIWGIVILIIIVLICFIISKRKKKQDQII